MTLLSWPIFGRFLLLSYCNNMHLAALFQEILHSWWLMLITSSLNAPSTELRKVKHQCTRTFGDIVSGSQLKLCVGMDQRARIECFIEAQAFLRSYDSAPRLPCPPPLPSAYCLSFSVFLCVAGPAYWQEGVGVEPDNTTARKLESLGLYKSFNPLWLVCACHCSSRLCNTPERAAENCLQSTRP